jgi:hypothetical protein
VRALFPQNKCSFLRRSQQNGSLHDWSCTRPLTGFAELFLVAADHTQAVDVNEGTMLAFPRRARTALDKVVALFGAHETSKLVSINESTFTRIPLKRSNSRIPEAVCSIQSTSEINICAHEGRSLSSVGREPVRA